MLFRKNGANYVIDVYLQDAWNFDCPCHYILLQRPKEDLGSIQESASVPSTITSLHPSNGPSSSVAGPLPMGLSFEGDGIPRAA